MGMMPHPERATEPLMGSTDGLVVFQSAGAGRRRPAPRMSAIAITPELIAQHQLTPAEYQKIVDILGREPSYTELGIFSVMWSEHCSYKSSRLHLKKLPTRGKLVVQGPGENAGIIDIGGGYVIAFKIESHNHPSFIEPFQGAATGVGGILRDIFTMGARPIAVLDSLRFGRLDDPAAGARNRRILRGVVAGIAHYGNCFGVPTVGGECIFEPCYDGNPLVNVFALGVCQKEDIFYAQAAGVGNPVIYVGARTGRDGIHGASMACAEFTEESKQKRPNVQVGDPFMEKLLLEACLEAMQTGAIVGIQDMGAAGLTCSTCEMGSRGGVGIEIELDRVPQRETGMTPYEIMLSESQERMLLVADKGREEEVFEVFRKWGLEAVDDRHVTGDGKLRVKHHGADRRRNSQPRTGRRSAALRPAAHQPPRSPPRPPAGSRASARSAEPPCPTLLAAPDICSKRWIWEQYDYQVRTNTIAGPGADAAIVRIKETGDFGGHVARWQRPLLLPFAARRRHAGGGRVLPQSCHRGRAAGGRHQLPELRQSRAARDHGAAGGGHRRHGGSLPLLRDAHHRRQRQPLQRNAGRRHLSHAGDRHRGAAEDRRAGHQRFQERRPARLFCWAASGDCDEARFGGTQYAKVILQQLWGLPPALDLDYEKRVHDAMREIVAEGLAESAHDLSDGGLAVARRNAVSARRRRAHARTSIPISRPELLLFHEGPSRILISTVEPGCGSRDRRAPWSEGARWSALQLKRDSRSATANAPLLSVSIESLRTSLRGIA